MAVKARTIADFRASHDRETVVTNKVKTALEELAKVGPEHYEYEGDFIRLAKISQTDVGLVREKFKAYIADAPAVHGKTARRVWCGSIKTAKTLRGE
jgi:hypothetical protein